jgi:hypothetical protein
MEIKMKKLVEFLGVLEPGLPHDDLVESAETVMGWVNPSLNPVKRTVEFVYDAEFLYGYSHEEALHLAEIIFND